MLAAIQDEQQDDVNDCLPTGLLLRPSDGLIDTTSCQIKAILCSALMRQLSSILCLICAGLTGSMAATWRSFGGRLDRSTGGMAESRCAECFPTYGGASDAALAMRPEERSELALGSAKR